MSNNYGFGGEEIREESSLRYLLGVFLAILILCTVFLYYYLGPSVDEFSGNLPSPAITEEPVAINIGAHTFAPKANFTVYPRARRGGVRDEVSLYALWPIMNGYTPAQRREFVENEPDTRRLDIVISKRVSAFTEEDRLNVLYLPQTVDQRGVRTPYQLTKFTFSEMRANVPTNGYANTEMYVGRDADENVIVLFCFKENVDLPSPECWREFDYSDSVEVTYRFKRPYLPEWRAIDTKIREYIGKIDQSAYSG